MKKLFSIFIFLFTITSVYAQKPIQFGVKGGLNLSGYLANDELNLYQDNTTAKAGLNAGFYSIIPITDRFAIQPEILYSQQGVNFVEPEAYVDYTYVDGFFGPDFVISEVGTYGDVEAQENLHYLNVPVLANIYLAPGLSLQLGPQFGFLLNGTARFDANNENLAGIITDYDDHIEITDDLSPVSLAASAGIQADLTSDLLLGLRYTFGLTDVADTSADDISISNQVGQFYVGYTF
jgi:hypothetical protein